MWTIDSTCHNTRGFLSARRRCDGIRPSSSATLPYAGGSAQTVASLRSTHLPETDVVPSREGFALGSHTRGAAARAPKGCASWPRNDGSARTPVTTREVRAPILRQGERRCAASLPQAMYCFTSARSSAPSGSAPTYAASLAWLRRAAAPRSSSASDRKDLDHAFQQAQDYRILGCHLSHRCGVRARRCDRCSDPSLRRRLHGAPRLPGIL